MDGNIVSISHAHSVVCALLAHGIRCESIRFVLQTEKRMLIAREHVDFSFLATNCHRRCSVVFIRKMPYMGLALVPVIRHDACVHNNTVPTTIIDANNNNNKKRSNTIIQYLCCLYLFLALAFSPQIYSLDTNTQPLALLGRNGTFTLATMDILHSW